MTEKTFRITLYGDKQEYQVFKKRLDGVPVSVWFRQQVRKFNRRKQ